MERKSIIRNQKGFTLIEIIATLIILGVLSAVAVPRYLDMVTNSRTQAVQGALGAAASNVSINFANSILAGGTVAAALTAAVGSNVTVGDYTVTYVTNLTDSNAIDITVTGPAGLTTNVPTASLTKTVTLL
ncbi:MAG: prepilin-type N-terminal cleavage/methylation domain-containing protein [Desulfobacteraceae bacterium]|nr:prepilin-type N-terminal cleavage/methylation domain-containing protein [Desulfobacteraceae bacterium]